MYKSSFKYPLAYLYFLFALFFQQIPERFLSTAIPSCTLIIELDEQGNIIRSLHDPDGERFSRISEVEEDAGHLYIGSFCVPYIGKVNTYKKPGL